MPYRSVEPASERVLVLTPVGRDAEMIRGQVVTDETTCEICRDLDSLLSGICSGAGVAIVAQEALLDRGAEALLTALEAQEPWSDIPVLLLAEPKTSKRTDRIGARLDLLERTNVTLLQRPLGIRFFSSSVRSALRARRRQYQMRNLNRELERALQLSDLFVSILGHDLRGPLAAIQMAAEVIVRVSPDTRALRPAGRILTSADRMTRMITQLLDFARARQGQGIPLHLEPMHLGALCQQAKQEVEDANPEASLEFRGIGDLSGVWDADRLGQVVTNLVANAVEHGAKTGPVEIEADGADASTVRLRVENPGTIPAEVLPTLFEAFKEAAARKAGEKKAGLGLGLFIAREIVGAHGGEIRAHSSEGRTVFEVTLPREARPVEPGSPLVLRARG